MSGRGLRLALRIVVAAVIVVAVVALLFTVVFPWVDARLQDPSIG